MTTITFPTNTTEVIDDIRGAIGRPVDFYSIVSTSGCPICALDPITNTSTDSFCPVCSGAYWLPTYNYTTISGHIMWGQIDKLQWESAGQYYDGDCRIQIKYTLANFDLLDNTEYVMVDGKKMDIRNKELRGVPQINRIILYLIERP